MSGGAPDEVWTAVRDAFARVLDRDPGPLSPATRTRELDVDSLVLVSVTLLVEEALAPTHGRLRLADDALEHAATLGEAAVRVRAALSAAGAGAPGQPAVVR